MSKKTPAVRGRAARTADFTEQRDAIGRVLTELPVDHINHPPHYTQGAIECIDAIAAQLTRSQLIGFLRGQIAKYNWRLEAKGDPAENLAKLQWYAERLAAVLAVPEA